MRLVQICTQIDHPVVNETSQAHAQIRHIQRAYSVRKALILENAPVAIDSIWLPLKCL